MKKTQSRGLPCRFPSDYEISKKTLERLKSNVNAETKTTLKALEAVSNPIRLRILRALMVKELCVCVLVSLLRVRYSKLSYHLNLLKEAGLVSSSKQENFLIYRLTNFGKSLLASIGS
ncbi:MAG: metalloregulator ArsR/SmtB family transcription factor [Candidatus Hadarchaeota archaeon]